MTAPWAPSPATPAAPAPWRSAFLIDLSTMPEADASFATVSPPSSDSLSPSFAAPHVRTVVMRCLFGSLARHPQNPAPPNPPVFESDMPVFTTDARMAKVSHLFASGPHPEDAASGSATGGGGPVEMVFWASKPAVQWRLAGRAFVLGPDADGETDAARRVREVLRGRMRIVDAKGDGHVAAWSWAREVTAVFGNQSPQARGWFRNPPSGTPVEEPLPDKRLGLGQTVDDVYDEVARKNFRVVVVVPDEVDQADLSDPKQPVRWRHQFVDGSWKTTEIWP